MIAFRGAQEERKVESLAKLLDLDKSEVLRRAVNSYYARFDQDNKAFDWLAGQLDDLPGSGRSDIAENHDEFLDEVYAQRSRHRR